MPCLSPIGGPLSPHAFTWIAGADLGWNPVTNLNFDLELMYQAVNQSTPNGALGTVYNFGESNQVFVPGAWEGNSNGLAGRLRITRYFVPNSGPWRKCGSAETEGAEPWSQGSKRDAAVQFELFLNFVPGDCSSGVCLLSGMFLGLVFRARPGSAEAIARRPASRAPAAASRKRSNPRWVRNGDMMKTAQRFSILAAVLALGLGAQSFGASAQDATKLSVTLKDHKFSPAEPTAPAGKPIVIELENQDKTPAEFESKTLRVEKVVPGGGKITVQVRALPAGPLPFLRRLPRGSRPKGFW